MCKFYHCVKMGSGRGLLNLHPLRSVNPSSPSLHNGALRSGAVRFKSRATD